MKNKKRISIIMSLLLIFQLFPFGAFEVSADPPNIETVLSIDSAPDGTPLISYSSAKGSYVSLSWNQPAGVESVQYAVYYCRSGQAFEEYAQIMDETDTHIELQQLNPGTVYQAYVKTRYVYQETDGTYVPAETDSNKVTFMTNLEVKVTPAGTDTIEIQWTDITYNQNNVSYAVYISESFLFAKTPVLDVTKDNIGTDKPVKRPGNGMLLYNASGLKAGTVYYVKIKPMLNDGKVTYLEESEIVCGYTSIIASMTKMSSSWWKLEWNPVTNSNLAYNYEVLYKVMRSVDGDLEKEISATKDSHVFVKLVGDNTYYRIKADVTTQRGEEVEVDSEKLYPIEGDIPANPAVPEIKDQLSGQVMEAGPTTLKILWKAPVTTNGQVDLDLSYDIWMLDNPQDINSDEVSPMVENLKVSPENYVYEMIGGVPGNNIVGFKYTLRDLNPETVYYLKMVAKKSYTVKENDGLVSKEFFSEPALKVIITPAEGSIDQPVVLAKPPLKVKTQMINGSEEQVVTPTSVILQWDNQWHEVWKDIYSSWEYLPEADISQAVVQGDVYRKVSYDRDIKFSVGYEVYTSSFDFSRLQETLVPMPMQFSDISNISSPGTIEFEVTGLSPNTTYVIWVRAYRSDLLKSGLSDPLIVTTKPDYQMPTEQPAVPKVNYSYAEDTYIDIGWNILDNYYYSIRYATVDNVEQGTTIELTPEQLKHKTKYRVEGLAADTVYYFWVSAKIMKSEESLTSDWSDVCIIRTKPYTPPDVPTGFGLKNITNPIGKDYVFFEWVNLDGLEYTLELAKKDDYSDAVPYELKSVGEYKAEGLTANTTYYARLYAYDPEKELKSGYAKLTVKTQKSNDEYNSGIDDDTANSEEVKAVKDSSGIGQLDASGIRAEKLIQQIVEGSGDYYTANFGVLSSDDIYKSDVKITPRVLAALGQTKKTFIIDNGKAALMLLPNLIEDDGIKKILQENPNCTLEIVFEKKTSTSDYTISSTLKSDIWKTTITKYANGSKDIIKTENTSIKIRLPYSKETDFDKSTMSGCIYDETQKTWPKVNTENNYDSINQKGYIYSDIPGSSDFAVMNASNGRFTDIKYHWAKAYIEAVANKYDLKSLGNNRFEPDRNVTRGEAVKIMLDIMGYKYDDNYLDAAGKSGITSGISINNEDDNALREEAASMITRVYELMKGQKVSSNISLARFADASRINSALLPRVKFAVEKGILSGSGNYLNPKNSMTRAELMVMIKTMLDLYNT